MTIRAVGLRRYLPVENEESLQDVRIERPTPGEWDLAVQVEAISVNPVDVKVRSPKDRVEGTPRILGWDAAGVVVEVGPSVTGFRKGDRVYYAGSIVRPGCNAEVHLVDARIAAQMPRTLGFADAAALPLTTLTAWEGLFDRMGIDPGGRHSGATVLVIGGAGGVGSMVIQLAKHAGLRVVATAARSETIAWTRKLGADIVLDHRGPLRPQLEAAGLGNVDYVFDTQSTEAYWDVMADLVAPEGRIVGIVETKAPLSLEPLRAKSATFSWELMFTRSMLGTRSLGEQGTILRKVATLVDEGRVVTTRTQTLGPIDAKTLRAAHAMLESGRAIGKIVLEGFR
jgi:NADPH:quinone reductase